MMVQIWQIMMSEQYCNFSNIISISSCTLAG